MQSVFEVAYVLPDLSITVRDEPVDVHEEIKMSSIICRVAETRKEIDDALRLRHQVFVQELRNLDPVRNAVPREVDSFDSPETTIHLVAYEGTAAVGVARIIRPNQEFAQSMGTRFGFDIESKFDLTDLTQKNFCFAETMRYCVISGARNRSVASVVHREAVRISRELGITHWIGSATIETNIPEEAARIASVAANLGFVRKDMWITPRQTFCPVNENSGAQFGSTGCQWERPLLSNDKLPRILAMYSRRLAARIIGPPLYDPRFRGYSIPIVMAVADQRFMTERRSASPAISSPIAA